MPLQILDYLAKNHIGDVSGLAGLVVSVVGFAVTIYQVVSAKTAAKRAESAASAARDMVITSDAISDVSFALTTIDEIKRLQRLQQWQLLPDRYSDLRKRLIAVRTRNPNLSERHCMTLQISTRSIKDLEEIVEEHIEDPKKELGFAHLNKRVSVQMDRLAELLEQLKPTKAKSND